MNTKSYNKYSIGDIINKLINKRITSLPAKQKSYSENRRDMPLIEELGPRRGQYAARIHAQRSEGPQNQWKKSVLLPDDMRNWLYSSKQNQSRLFSSKKIYSDSLDKNIKGRQSSSENPQKTAKKGELLNAYIIRKKYSGQLQNYLSKTDRKMTTLFRETFRTLKHESKGLASKEKTQSQFYLTTRRNEKLDFKFAANGDSLKFIQKTQQRDAIRRNNHFYRTFCK